MQQHPVPQNVTNFEFKLIGDMTVRQFAYLAAGIIVGYIFYTLRWPDLIRFPLAFFAGFIGFAFAFMPIEERPLDRWFVNFIKSVYSPTQFLWKKQPQIPEFWSKPIVVRQVATAKYPIGEMRQKLEEYLKTLPQKPQNSLDQIELDRLTNLNLGIKPEPFIPIPLIPPTLTRGTVKIRRLHGVNATKQGIIFPANERKIDIKPQIPIPKIKPEQSPKEEMTTANPSLSVGPGGVITKNQTTPLDQRPSAQITPQIVKKVEKKVVQQTSVEQNVQLKQQVEELQKQITKLKTEPIPETMTGKEFDLKIKELIDKLTETEKLRIQTEKELVGLRRKLDVQESGRPVIKPQTYQDSDTPKQPTAKYVSGQTAQQKGIPTLTTVPNIISGIVTSDVEGILIGAIIVIKDKNENPVRALKTNKVGQFIISTPLENGIYHLELEKEGYEFDIIEVELNGSVLQPLDIKARKSV